MQGIFNKASRIRGSSPEHFACATIRSSAVSIRSVLVNINIILPIRLVRRTAYFPRWYNGVLRCNAICTGPPTAVRGPARPSAPALRFLGISDRGHAFNGEVPAKSLCKCPVRLWLPCIVMTHYATCAFCRSTRQTCPTNLYISDPNSVTQETNESKKNKEQESKQEKEKSKETRPPSDNRGTQRRGK